jgi:hypothetical protein
MLETEGDPGPWQVHGVVRPEGRDPKHWWITREQSRFWALYTRSNQRGLSSLALTPGTRLGLYES